MQYIIVSVSLHNKNTMSVLHHSLYLNLCQIVVLKPLWSTKVFVSNQVNTIKTALLTAKPGGNWYATVGILIGCKYSGQAIT